MLVLPNIRTLLSVKFWPGTTEFQQLTMLCTCKSTSAQRSGESLVMAPMDSDIGENWCTLKKMFGITRDSGKSSFQAPNATTVGKIVCMCVCLSHRFLKRGGMYFWNTSAKNKPISAVYEERQV